MFLSKYCSIMSVLTTWRRCWNTWTNVNVLWFHVTQNCRKLLNSFTIFSFIFWKSSCEKTFCISNSSLVQLKADHVCSMISFILLKSLCTTTSTLSRCRHTYRIKDHSRYHVNHFCLLSYALKFWNCESFYRLEIGSSS